LISSFGTTILVDLEFKIRVWPPGLDRPEEYQC